MTLDRPYRGHWLEGQMVDCEEDVIEQRLISDRPTGNQLVTLGLEESRGRDRAAVYRLFARFRAT